MRIGLMWKVQAQFAGYALAVEEVAGLELCARSPTASPLEDLLAGRVEFATVSPAQLLGAGRRAREVAFIALFMTRSPVVLVGSKSRKGERLSDLTSARVGVWPGEDLEVRAMLATAGVSLEQVDFVPVEEGFDEFIAGELDLLQATTYNELPALSSRVPDQSDLVVHRPASSGVDVAKDGLVASIKLFGERPHLVDAVVGAAVRGWRRAIEDGEAAVDAVCRLESSLSVSEQQQQLAEIVKLIDPSRSLGRPDRAEFERAARVFAAIGQEVDANEAVIEPGPRERALDA